MGRSAVPWKSARLPLETTERTPSADWMVAVQTWRYPSVGSRPEASNRQAGSATRSHSAIGIPFRVFTGIRPTWDQSIAAPSEDRHDGRVEGGVSGRVRALVRDAVLARLERPAPAIQRERAVVGAE